MYKATQDTTTINGYNVNLKDLSQKELKRLLNLYPNIGCIEYVKTKRK